MTAVHLLTGAAAEALYARVAAVFTGLTGKDASSSRQPWLFEILLQAYPEHNADALMARIDTLVATHGSDVLRVIEDHSPGAPDYLEERDELYAGPEVLLIADLARHYPARLRAVAVPSDYAAEVDPMASELDGK